MAQQVMKVNGLVPDIFDPIQCRRRGCDGSSTYIQNLIDGKAEGIKITLDPEGERRGSFSVDIRNGVDGAFIHRHMGQFRVGPSGITIVDDPTLPEGLWDEDTQTFILDRKSFAKEGHQRYNLGGNYGPVELELRLHGRYSGNGVVLTVGYENAVDDSEIAYQARMDGWGFYDLDLICESSEPVAELPEFVQEFDTLTPGVDAPAQVGTVEEKDVLRVGYGGSGFEGSQTTEGLGNTVGLRLKAYESGGKGGKGSSGEGQDFLRYLPGDNGLIGTIITGYELQGYIKRLDVVDGEARQTGDPGYNQCAVQSGDFVLSSNDDGKWQLKIQGVATQLTTVDPTSWCWFRYKQNADNSAEVEAGPGPGDVANIVITRPASGTFAVGEVQLRAMFLHGTSSKKGAIENPALLCIENYGVDIFTTV